MEHANLYISEQTCASTKTKIVAVTGAFDRSPSPGLVLDAYHECRRHRHLKQASWLKKSPAICGIEAAHRILGARQCKTCSRGKGRSVSQPHKRKEQRSCPLLRILLALIIVGFLLWLVNRFIAMV